LGSQDLEAVISQGWALAKCQHRGFAVLAIESSETRRLGRLEGDETWDETWKPSMAYCSTVGLVEHDLTMSKGEI